jgi:hypothetical protein
MLKSRSRRSKPEYSAKPVGTKEKWNLIKKILFDISSPPLAPDATVSKLILKRGGNVF